MSQAASAPPEGVQAARAALERGEPAIVWRREVSDLETPVGAYLKLAAGGGPSFLLESVEGGERQGRFSIIGWDPDRTWRCRRGVAETAPGWPRSDNAFEPAPGPALASLRAEIAAAQIAPVPDLPRLAAGLFGYLGYDMVREAERLEDGNPDPLGLPDALFIRPRMTAVFDAVRQEIILSAVIRPDGRTPAETLIEEAAGRLEHAAHDLARPLAAGAAQASFAAKPYGAADPAPQAASTQAASTMTPEAYRAAVERAKAYIHAGDVFQTVLSQRFSVPFEHEPFALYRALRRINPSPYLFFFDFETFQIAGSSPEILVRVRDGVVTLRPIAGTRPRREDPEADEAEAASLLADPKERAEHLMLLDLGRNDVGRASRNVRVTDQFFIERYSHVMHIVSNVEGDLAPDKDALDAVFAGFPAGTVSGAPKVRAMQIIEELETIRRGPFYGAIGYFDSAGSIDSAILLRTGVIKDGVLHVQAGAGVVYDSDPAYEQRECEIKAAAVLRAAVEAARFSS